jgi:hypothetical protein
LLLLLASIDIFGSESRELVITFYCLRFETSLFVASYDSQGYSGGIGPRLHTAYFRIKIKMKVEVEVSVYLGIKPLETHGIESRHQTTTGGHTDD